MSNDMSNKKICIVDEDLATFFTIKYNLADRDYSVLSSLTVEEGISKIKEHRPNLIIMETDFAEDYEKGLEIINALKEDKSLENIPVMVLTKRVDSKLEERYKQKGVNDYMTKPFNPNDLYQRIKQLLN